MSTGVQPFNLRITGGPTAQKPWLVLGKGPSFAKYHSGLADMHNVFALNHAMRGTRALVGHAADIEVFDHLKIGDLSGIEYLCVPWIPHVRQKRPFYPGKSFFGPGPRTLIEYCQANQVLQEFLQRARLLSYNLSSAPKTRRDASLPTVDAYTFSAAIAVRLLAQSGATEVRTLGIDGGNAYSSAFRDVEPMTKLQTIQANFDSQFLEISKTMNQFSFVSGPLDWKVPARVFVGCMPEQELAYRVLEYSIKSHASISVTVERLHEAIERRGIHVPLPRAPKDRGRTPFSFQRFAIPALRDYCGRAIYLDSDMLVLRDIRSLWAFDMGEHQMVSAAQPTDSGRPPQFSVMLIDCGRLPWSVDEIVRGLDAGRYTYEQLMHEMATVSSWSAALPEAWNSLEKFDADTTCLVHFTDMDGQPWLNPLHRFGSLWSRYLLSALKTGAIAESFVAEEVAKGNVRPSLLVQVSTGQSDPRRLPFSVLRRDLTDFYPPHRRKDKTPSRLRHELYRARELVSHALSEGLIYPARQRARRFASSIIAALTR